MAPTGSADTLTPRAGFWFQTIVAVACRPRLWWTALRQYVSFVPPHWWRTAPFLPVPARSYVRFRLETAYGPGGEPRAADLMRYLEWCRAGRQVLRGR